MAADSVDFIMANLGQDVTLTGEDLLRKLAMLAPDISAGGSLDRKRWVQIGQDWWNDHQDLIKKEVCKYSSSEFNVAVIGSLLSTLSIKFGEPMAVYLCIFGIRKPVSGWCREEE